MYKDQDLNKSAFIMLAGS